jgi:O-antigen ligase
MKDALIAIFQNPFSGVGAGAWTYKQSIYQTSPYSIRYIHNGLLQIALDSGIVALTLFMIAIVLFYKDVLSRVIRGAESFDITVFLIVSLTLLHSILDVDLSFPAVFNVLAGCLAIITQNKS